MKIRFLKGNARQIALNKYKRLLSDAQRSIDLIKRIPLNKNILIRTMVRTTANNMYEECIMILVGKKFNRDSIRFKILAQEKEDLQSKSLKQIGKPYTLAKSDLCTIRFKDIMEWKEWNIHEEAAFVIGFDYVSDELKKIAFEE